MLKKRAAEREASDCQSEPLERATEFGSNPNLHRPAEEGARQCENNMEWVDTKPLKAGTS